MKYVEYIRQITLMALLLGSVLVSTGQSSDEKALSDIIDSYTLARTNKDTVLLKKILTQDVDQLVSTGEWRNGIRVAVQGMLRSSETNSGSRTLKVDKIRLLDNQNAIVDCRYEIENADGTQRKMWSTFIAVKKKGQWKIAGIRNMLPAPPSR